MDTQVQVMLDKTIYDRLRQLCAPPHNDINAVIERLLFHEGIKGRAVTELEAEQRHRSMDEEMEAARAGVYDASGIST
jgi:hypothetical protein